MTVECTTEASPKAITYWVFKVMMTMMVMMMVMMMMMMTMM